MIRSVFILRNCYLPIRCAAMVRRWDSFLVLMKEVFSPVSRHIEVDFLPQAFDEAKVLLMMFRFLHVLYWASIPPSTTREVPVVNFASSEQR